jgi:chaperonin cofactor prefoldin
MSNKIDYLTEDQPIPGQKFALVSIVGPNLKQKCDVYGIKIRGVTDNLEQAKTMTKRIMRSDNKYDIYNVEVGKFFPVAVDPLAVGNVEYQNEALNSLVKNYMENREEANDHWHKRKNDLMAKAIKEGKNQEELANRPEHPIAVLQRINTFETKSKALQEELKSLQQDLNLSKEKYNTYTPEEKEFADSELRKAIKENVDPESVIPKESEKTVDDIRNEIMNELNEEKQQETQVNTVHSTLDELKLIDIDLLDLDETLSLLNKDTSPSVHKRLSDKIDNLRLKKETLKTKLQNKNSVNDYMKQNYQGNEGDYHDIF